LIFDLFNSQTLATLIQMSKSGDFEAVAADIRKILHQPEYDDGSAGPVLVRLAWHSAGTYCAETDTGGSNGAGMRYEVICYLLSTVEYLITDSV
jgi:cytochrome c peroxidase